MYPSGIGTVQAHGQTDYISPPYWRYLVKCGVVADGMALEPCPACLVGRTVEVREVAFIESNDFAA